MFHHCVLVVILVHFLPDLEMFPWLNKPCNAVGQSLFERAAETSTRTAPVSTVSADSVSNIIAGYVSTVTAGSSSTVSAGPVATITAGPVSTVTAGPSSTITAGLVSTVSAGPVSTVSAGSVSTVTAGSVSTVTADPVATITAGPVTTVIAGPVTTLATAATVETDAFVDILGEEELNSIDGLNIDVPRGNDSNWLEYSTLMGNTLPLKSRITYLKSYSELETYLKKENKFVAGVIPSEHVILNYFFS